MPTPTEELRNKLRELSHPQLLALAVQKRGAKLVNALKWNRRVLVRNLSQSASVLTPECKHDGIINRIN
jgi:hypothetical protein